MTTTTPPKAPTGRVAAIARHLGVTVHSRKRWGSQPATGPWPLARAQAGSVPDVYAYRRRAKPHHQIPARPTDTAVMHITDTQRTRDVCANFRVVERIGFDRFGSGVSYNWMIDPATGEVGIGQPIDAKGTHTVNEAGVPGFSYDLNYVALGFAIVGQPSDPISPAARRALARLLAAHMIAGYLNDGADFKPHRLFNPAKSCPGDRMVELMPEVWAVARGIAQEHANKQARGAEQ